MRDVTTIGSATRDVFLESDLFKVHHHSDSPTGLEQCFVLGSKVEVDRVHFEIGGGATNAAVTFARQGLNTAYLGKVGDDLAGREAKKDLEEEKISTDLLILDKKTHTDYSTIILTPEGQRTILVYRCSSRDFAAEDIKLADLKTRWIYMTSVAGDFAILEKVINFAQKMGIKVAINPGAKELNHKERLAPLMKKVEVLILNRKEAAQFSGVPFDEDHKIWQAVCGVYGKITVITDTKNGAVVSDGNDIFRIGILDGPVIDRTGAGDSFGSGFVAGYIKRGDMEYGLKLATVNATSVVGVVGAKPGIVYANHPIPHIPVGRMKLAANRGLLRKGLQVHFSYS